VMRFLTYTDKVFQMPLGGNLEQRARVSPRIAARSPSLRLGVRDVLHSGARPRIRKIGAHHDLAGATFATRCRRASEVKTIES